MRHFAGNTKSYHRMLARFEQTHRDDGFKILQQLEEGNSQEAQRTAHSLKGVAATLGADRVSELAASIEQSIKQGKASSEISQAIAVLNQRLTDAMNYIADLQETEQSEQTIDSVSPLQLELEHIKTLQRLLADDDIASVDVWNQVRPSLVQSAATDELKNIDKCIADVDFPAALEWLNVLIAKIIDA